MANLNQINVSPVYVGPGGLTKMRDRMAGAGGLTLGQAVYTDPNVGAALPTSTLTAGQYKFRGLVVKPALGAAQGSPVTVVESGYVAGFDLSALAYDAPIYLSDTPGMLSSTPGTNNVQVGIVAALTDRDPSTNLPSKLIYLFPQVS